MRRRRACRGDADVGAGSRCAAAIDLRRSWRVARWTFGRAFVGASFFGASFLGASVFGSIVGAVGPLATAQVLPVLPDGASTEIPFVCPPPEEPLPPPTSDAEAAERLRREAYREVFPAYVTAAGPVRASRLWVPVDGVRVSQIADTWGAPRGGGRLHEGQDLFADKGTPVRAAAPGFVWRIGARTLGGLTVTVVGGGGVRYYYAHLSAYGGIREGDAVGVSDVLGYVGRTGNAATTPPHLHFGVYVSDDPDDPCSWDAIDPLPLLVDR